MSTENIQIQCTHCAAGYNVPASAIGRSVQCQKCNQTFVVAATAVASPSAPTQSQAAAQTSAPAAHNPIPPHLLQGGGAPTAAMSAPTDPLQTPGASTEFGVEAHTDKMKEKYTKSSGGVGMVLVILGSLMALVFVCAVLYVYFKRPDLFKKENTIVIREGGSQTGTGTNAGSQEISWANATSKTVVQNGVAVKVERVEFGPIRARDQRNMVQQSGGGNFLQVHISIRNDTQGAVDYQSWYGNVFDAKGKQVTAALKDNKGHIYQMLTFGDVTKIQGHIEGATLDPKEKRSDMIVYEISDDVKRDEVEYYRLELPAEATGRGGVFRFEIPVSMVNES